MAAGYDGTRRRVKAALHAAIQVTTTRGDRIEVRVRGAQNAGEQRAPARATCREPVACPSLATHDSCPQTARHAGQQPDSRASEQLKRRRRLPPSRSHRARCWPRHAPPLLCAPAPG